MQLDALREIAGIGAGNAATALAEILSGRVEMSAPELRIADIAGIPDALGGPEREVACVLLTVAGGFKGMLMFMLEKQLAHELIGLLLNKKINGWEQLDPMDLSMLKEVGNIAASAFAGSLGEMTGLDIRVSPPEIAVDMAGAILNYPAAVFGATGDKALYVREDFGSGKSCVACHLLVIPSPDSLERLLERLGAAHG
jgi:chemotaxis protein CheC